MQLQRIITAGLAVCLLATYAPSGRADDKTFKRDRYLVLDSRIIEKTKNAKLTVGTIKRYPGNPLFSEEEPWEIRYDNGYPSVIFDEEEGIYKCWYNPFIVDPVVSTTSVKDKKTVTYMQVQDKTGRGVSGREFGLCYATSKDGIKWEKPLLDIVRWDGRLTNILMRRLPGQEKSDVEKGPHGIAVLKDLTDKDPGRRYKMMLSPGRRQTAVSFSPDGLHWSVPRRVPQLNIDEPAYNFAWLPTEKKFAVFTRRFDIQNDDPVRKARAVFRLDTGDFNTWSESKLALLAADRTKQVYHMPVFYYQGVYIGLPAVFDIKTDKVYTELAWSPDSKQWNRIDPGNPLIGTTEEEGHEWGCIYSAQSPVVLDNEIRMYYASSDGPHYNWRKGHFNLATLRLDGFAGYETAENDRTGTIVTKPVDVSGGALHVSADVAPGGSIRVAVVDDQSRTIAACRPITSDVTNGQIKWQNAKPLTTGKLALRFELKNAKLYSFGFR